MSPAALGYIDTKNVPEPEEARVEQDIACEFISGKAIMQAAYDPQGSRMRQTGTLEGVA